MGKIGVFGGTFDPVHYGHIYLTKAAICECKLDKLIIMPAYEQPFKPNGSDATGEHRLNMVKLAFAGSGAIEVSDIEIKKAKTSYTIDTLKEVKRMFGSEADVYFIIGTDAFMKVEKWKDAEELLRDYRFIIGTRPGFREEELGAFIEYLRRMYHTDITKISNRQILISSTHIKQMIKTGENMSEFLQPEVERYILANGLY